MDDLNIQHVYLYPGDFIYLKKKKFLGLNWSNKIINNPFDVVDSDGGVKIIAKEQSTGSEFLSGMALGYIIGCVSIMFIKTRQGYYPA